MPDSQCYRNSAAQCLVAAKQASQPGCRELRLSMATSWLSLARQEEAKADLHAGAATTVSGIVSLTREASSQAPAQR
jgi:hypothetical protein